MLLKEILKSFIIKKRDIIYSEPSYSETILSNLKEGNLIYSHGNTENFILVKQSDNNFWIPKDAVEKISAEEERNFIKAKIIMKPTNEVNGIDKNNLIKVPKNLFLGFNTLPINREIFIICAI